MFEKTSLLAVNTAPPQRSRGFLRPPFVALLGCLALFSLYRYLSYQEADYNLDHDEPIESIAWSWDKIKPSRSLEWHDCYKTYQCARLDVPMDWQEPSEDQRVVLGIIKLPAKSTDNPVSPVFFNPGGPGGSGVHVVQKIGNQIQTIVGDNHDVISWDPRGVGLSVPRAECWIDPQKRMAWDSQRVIAVDQHPGVAYDYYAQQQAYAGRCESAMNETGILPYLGTTYHARDMLEILDQTGHKKLRYWGISYGTVLAGVFATLFPDRVERMVSDGNVGYDWWLNLTRLDFIEDADKIFDAFDTRCHLVGSEKCALWAPTPLAVQARRARILSSLKEKPVLVPAWSQGTGPDMPLLVTYSLLQSFTRQFGYNPVPLAETFDKVYASLEVGDASTYYNFLTGGGKLPLTNEVCGLSDTPAMAPLEVPTGADAFPAIMCSESTADDDTPENFASYVERLLTASKWTGPATPIFKGSCIGWKTQTKWKFSPDNIKKDTAFPILFLNTVFDNVTPLSGARSNSARFPSSSLLILNSYGHTTFASPSMCITKHVRAYFQDGALPPYGSECEPNYDMFDFPAKETVGELRDHEDAELSKAILELSKNLDFQRSFRPL